ncbi:MAG: hypothetical protein QOI01_3484 [Mycobacterium sp.]|jgi:hypothetical protein|nr:hypothetical protein [Mycobacterium sp.]
MLEGGQPDKPAILVLSSGADALEREVLAGIEEEGVPYVIEHVVEHVVERPTGGDDARGLAQLAAGRSSLSVGVGIDARGRVCVQHELLAEPPSGLFSSGTAERECARTLGHNAARIVVGIPLRSRKVS